MAVIGRPSDYCDAVVIEICDRLSNGESLRSVCRDSSMPTKKTVLTWLKKYPEFLSQYELAKAESSDTYAEDLVDIADTDPGRDEAGRVDSGAVQHARLRCDVRKWIASKLKPKKYGDKIEQTHTGEVRFISVDTGVPKAPDG